MFGVAPIKLKFMDEKYDKQKMLALMQVEFDFVLRTLDLMTPDQMLVPDVEGSWSVKDTIAHLNAWHRRTLTWLEMGRLGVGEAGRHPIEPEPGFGWDEFDAINALSYQQDINRELNDVLNEFVRTFQQLHLETQALSEAELFGKTGLSLFFRDPLFNYIAGNTFEHYQHHIPPLREWLERISTKQTIEHQAVKEERSDD